MINVGNFSAGDIPGVQVHEAVNTIPVREDDYNCYSDIVLDAGEYVRVSSKAEWFFLHCYSCECDTCLLRPAKLHVIDRRLGFYFAHNYQSCSGRNWKGEVQDKCHGTEIFTLSWSSWMMTATALIVDVIILLYTYNKEGVSPYTTFKVLAIICNLMNVVTLMTAEVTDTNAFHFLQGTSKTFIWMLLLVTCFGNWFDLLAVVVAKVNSDFMEVQYSARRLHPILQKMDDMKSKADSFVRPILSCRSGSMVLFNLVQVFASFGFTQGSFVSVMLHTQEAAGITLRGSLIMDRFVRWFCFFAIPFSETRRKGLKIWTSVFVCIVFWIPLLVLTLPGPLRKEFTGARIKHGVAPRIMQEPDMMYASNLNRTSGDYTFNPL